MNYCNLWIRSLLFWIYSTCSIALYSFICLLCAPLSLEKRHAAIRVFARAYFFVLKHLCHIDYQIHGLENIPTDTAAVIMCKHQSTFETFLLPLIFYTPAVIVKRELLWVPFFGWALALAKPISINRSNKRRAMQQILEKGTAALRSGRWVIVFPEGTRIPYGKVGHYRLGGARLAVSADVPIVPVSHNAGRYWPRRRFIKYPGTVQIVIGPPIVTKGRAAEEVLVDTRNWIENTARLLETFVDKTA